MANYINNEIRFRAMRELEARRRDAELKNARAEERLSELPRYGELTAARRGKFVEFSDAMARGDDKAAARISGKIKELSESISALAAEENIALENWHCAKCRDTGRLESGEYCSCFNRLIDEYYREEAGLNRLPRVTFSDHKQGLNEMLDKLYAGMRGYTESFPDNKKRRLIFSGSVGVGKTYLVAAIANEIIAKGYNVTYISAIELTRLFLNYHMAPINEKDSIFAPLKRADMLIIDDLGVEPIYNGISIPYLYHLLEIRGAKHMIITTNLTLEELETRYGERIYSRIVDVDNAMMLKMTGCDLRLKKKRDK